MAFIPFCHRHMIWRFDVFFVPFPRIQDSALCVWWGDILIINLQCNACFTSTFNNHSSNDGTHRRSDILIFQHPLKAFPCNPCNVATVLIIVVVYFKHRAFHSPCHHYCHNFSVCSQIFRSYFFLCCFVILICSEDWHICLSPMSLCVCDMLVSFSIQFDKIYFNRYSDKSKSWSGTRKWWAKRWREWQEQSRKKAKTKKKSRIIMENSITLGNNTFFGRCVVAKNGKIYVAAFDW